jgi:2-dehydro-3-deoxyphosphogluconate aldolase/(4S)-4-hydroxy-2-oxoglutarate aldolase
MDTLSALHAARIVPVVVLDDARDADALGAALVAGGLPVAEVTFRTAAAGDSIRALADRGDILVGAGTVLTAEQVDQAVARSLSGAGNTVSSPCPAPSRRLRSKLPSSSVSPP